MFRPCGVVRRGRKFFCFCRPISVTRVIHVSERADAERCSALAELFGVDGSFSVSAARFPSRGLFTFRNGRMRNDVPPLRSCSAWTEVFLFLPPVFRHAGCSLFGAGGCGTMFRPCGGIIRTAQKKSRLKDWLRTGFFLLRLFRLRAGTEDFPRRGNRFREEWVPRSFSPRQPLLFLFPSRLSFRDMSR